MKINQNISAVIVNDQLLRNENSLSASVKRLSSGIKFNDAKDNPSGMAISFKMQAQINALNRASCNSTDGTSMVETIDNSMGEMTEVLQRMRELCVQAANGTNTPEDLNAIQEEIGKLKQEVNRISTDTEFNGKKLLDGSLDRRTYVTQYSATGFGASMFEQITNVNVSDEVQANMYHVAITKAPERAAALTGPGTAGTGPNNTVGANQEGNIYINGVKVEIREGMTAGDVYKELRDAGNTGWVNVIPTNGTQSAVTEDTLDSQGYEKSAGYTSFADQLVFTSQRYGSEESVTIECDNPDLRALLGINAAVVKVSGEDAGVSIQQSDLGAGVENNYTGQAEAGAVGDKVTISDKSGFQITFDLRADIAIAAPAVPPAVTDQTKISIEVTDIGTLQLQIGANENQEMAVRVPILNTETLYIDDLDVTKVDGGDRGIAESDYAISVVSAARSLMGAYENRLDYVKGGLDATEEDMTTAISRLGDVDMAQEMTQYTNANVLTQASISVLAQANDLPQQVLSLLQ